MSTLSIKTERIKRYDFTKKYFWTQKKDSKKAHLLIYKHCTHYLCSLYSIISSMDGNIYCSQHIICAHMDRRQAVSLQWPSSSRLFREKSLAPDPKIKTLYLTWMLVRKRILKRFSVSNWERHPEIPMLWKWKHISENLGICLVCLLRSEPSGKWVWKWVCRDPAPPHFNQKWRPISPQDLWPPMLFLQGSVGHKHPLFVTRTSRPSARLFTL